MNKLNDLIDDDIIELKFKQFTLYKKEIDNGFEHRIKVDQVDNIQIRVLLQLAKDNKKIIELLENACSKLNEIRGNTGTPPLFSGKPEMR